jgi:hypothetical protein
MKRQAIEIPVKKEKESQNMIADMYKRREKLAYIGFISLVLIGVGFVFYSSPSSTEQWLESVALLFPALMILGVAIASRNKYNKVKGLAIPVSNASIVDLNHIVIKKDAAWLPKLLVFEKSGAFIGTFQIKRIPWWAYPILIYKSSMITFFPIEMVFTSNKGEIVFSCRRKGFKQSIVDIISSDDEHVGSYIQEEFKSLVNIKGELRDRDGDLLLNVKSSGFTGDFTLNDGDGHLWARFYNGRFPHEFTTIFRDVYNDMVEMSDRLSEKHKILLLGMVGYLFLNRNTRE